MTRPSPTRLESHVLRCGSVALRLFSQMPIRRISAGRTDHERAQSSEVVGPPIRRPARGKKLFVGAILSLTVGLLYAIIPDNSPSRSKSSPALNDETFRKFTVVSNEQISPTSFILTVEPSLSSDARENAEVIRRAWDHGLWSVEVKQPQLQIARHYTPLPPPPSQQQQQPPQDGHGATLRFLVRRYEGGEVSRYLSRLRGRGALGAGGDVVELRGPHLGFDVAARLGDAGRDVVFLAGGTGIAPALQMARRMLSVPGGEGLSVQILWANRSALDCVGCPRLGTQGRRSWWPWPTSNRNLNKDEGPGAPSPIVQQLRDLEAVYKQQGKTLELKCVVDEEGSRVSAGDLTAAVSRPPLPAASTALSRARGTPGQATTSDQETCWLHSQRLLQDSTEDADAQEEKGTQVSGTTKCKCNGDGARGKNLFMISGPDGFVSAYVGPKVWAAGAERQGPLGGLVGELRKRDPKSWTDWLILKQ